MLRTCEQGVLLTIGMAWPGIEPVVQTTSFAAYCERADEETTRTNSGVAPANWAVPEADAPSAPAPALAVRRLSEFAATIALPATLRYSRITARRWVLEPFAGWRSRLVDVFALTGRLHLANGRFMSVGWSGAGDGLAQLGEGPARERLSWVARKSGEAAPAISCDGPVVLAAQPAAVISHEAVGHFAEASADPKVDLGHRLGCRLAADDLDVLDDPTCAAAAAYEVDDDGIVALGATRVVENGVLVRQLHGRASAMAAGGMPTANARSSQITLPPIPRMSNLIVPPGTASFNELVEGAGNGVIIHHLSHGFSRGIHVEARVVLGETIRCGRATGRFFAGGRVVEQVDVLTRCAARARESQLNPNALCGKHGQILYDVGTVAPPMRLSRLRIFCMSVIDRSIAFARTRDGRAATHFRHRVTIDGAAADVSVCAVDPSDFDASARAAWERWRSHVPDTSGRPLIAECGLLREGQVERPYTVVHHDGTILEIDGMIFDYPTNADPLEWSLRPVSVPLVIGPSAVLALVDFALDGLLGPERAHGCPLHEGFSIVDTPHSPYAPQHREAGASRLVGTVNSGIVDDATFLLLQRSERWQRPLNALYHVSRRNLAISYPVERAEPPDAVVIDTLAAECEPTLAASDWIATWHVRSHNGSRWGRGHLSITWEIPRVLDAVCGAVSPPLPGCIRDAIEGDIFGLAPSLLLDARSSTLAFAEMAS